MPRPLEIKCVPCDLKATADVDGRDRIAGRAAVLLNIDSGNDIIAPGAFKADLGSPSEIFVGGLNHNWDQPIARLKSATEADGALNFESGTIVDTTHGSDVKKLIQAGIINQASIGYKALEFKHLNGPDEIKSFWAGHGYTPDALDLERINGKVRLLTRIKLYEVSPVTIPMNVRSSIGAVKMFGSDYGMPFSMGGPGQPTLDDAAMRIRDSVVGIFLDYLCMSLRTVISNEMVPMADRLDMVTEVFDQTRDGLVEHVRLLAQAGDTGTGTAAGTEYASAVAATLDSLSTKFRASLLGPDPDSSPFTFDRKALEPGADWSDHAEAVVSAVDAFVRRADSRHSARFKVGRMLSQANLDEIATVADAMEAGCGRLRDLIGRAIPKEKVAAPPTTTAEMSPVPEAKGVVPYKSGPVSESETWDGAAAEARVRKWASKDGSGSKDQTDWAKLATAYAYVDADGEGSSFGAYHLLHHDVEDGKLVVSRRGVFAAAVIAQGGRGGGEKFLAGLPDGAEAGIKAHLGKHYADMEMTAPWDQAGKSAGAPPTTLDPSEVEGLFSRYLDTIAAPALGLDAAGR